MFAQIGNSKPLTIIGGVNVLESKDLAFSVCEIFKITTEKLGMPFIFKASFDKANRTSLTSYRGPGIEKGLEILADLKREFSVPVLTDVHEHEQVKMVAEVVDVLQIPAFLARQTDLVVTAANSNLPVNIKKPQFMSPQQTVHVVRKFRSVGNNKVLICERGAQFGYDNLVVDMLGLDTMKTAMQDVPIILDATHALQRRDPFSSQSGGRADQFMALARSGVAVGLAGLFMEAHTDPKNALCDGPSALPTSLIEDVLSQIHTLDDCVKSFNGI